MKFGLVIIAILTNNLGLVEPKRDILVNTYVHRTIHLENNQYLSIFHNITFDNLAEYPVSVYKFEIEPQIGPNFRYIIWIENGTMLHSPIVKYVHNNVTHRYIQINLLQPLSSGARSNIYVRLILFNYIRPVAETRNLLDPAWVMYKGNQVYYSAYNTYDQLLHFEIAQVREFELTHDQLLRKSENLVQYGPYKYVEHYTEKMFTFKFVSKKPIILVERLERTVDASSLFGFIKIVDHVQIVNAGGKLKGEFWGNVDDMTNNSTENTRIRGILTKLPADATQIKYYDNIGSIYTISQERFYDHINCYLQFRYPLYNGWKIKYTLEYRVPASEFLFFRKRYFRLYARLLDHVYDDMVILETVTKVILPTGARNISFVLPKNANESSALFIRRLKDETEPGLLWMPDKAVLKFLMIRSFEFDISDGFYVEFRLKPQPFLLGAYIVSLLAAVFLAIVVWNHSDLAIDPEWTLGIKDKVTKCIELY